MYCSDSSGFPKIRIESESIWYAVISIVRRPWPMPIAMWPGSRQLYRKGVTFLERWIRILHWNCLYMLKSLRPSDRKRGGTPSSTFGRLEKMLVRDYIHHGILVRYNWNSVNCRYDTLLCSFTVGKSNDSLVSAGGVCVIHTRSAHPLADETRGLI